MPSPAVGAAAVEGPEASQGASAPATVSEAEAPPGATLAEHGQPPPVPAHGHGGVELPAAAAPVAGHGGGAPLQVGHVHGGGALLPAGADRAPEYPREDAEALAAYVEQELAEQAAAEHGWAHPGPPAGEPVARLFVSSPFRDFAEERELLTKLVFPQLRGLCAARCVAFVPVDLRWGITAESAQEARVLSICLSEIDKSNFFMSMYGARYGWHAVGDGTAASAAADALFEENLRRAAAAGHAWVRRYADRSVTEHEILHGALLPGAAARLRAAPPYLRDEGYVPAPELAGAFGPESARAATAVRRLRAELAGALARCEAVLLLGESGSGKSAVLSAAAARAAAAPEAGPVEAAAGRIAEEVPASHAEMAAVMPAWLAAAAEGAPRLTLVVDAVDMLRAPPSEALAWLPAALPPTPPSSSPPAGPLEAAWAARHWARPPASSPSPRSTRRGARRWRRATSRSAARRSPPRSSRASSRRAPPPRPSTSTSSSTSSASSGLRAAGRGAGALLAAAPTVPALCGEVFARAEAAHGAEAVAEAARALWASRGGLAEAELCLALRLPHAGLSPLLLALSDLLAPASGRYRLGHRFVEEAVRGRYLAGGEPDERAAHSALADAFLAAAAREGEGEEEEEEGPVPLSRLLEEGPHQLARAGRWADLRAFLARPRRLEAMLADPRLRLDLAGLLAGADGALGAGPGEEPCGDALVAPFAAGPLDAAGARRLAALAAFLVETARFGPAASALRALVAARARDAAAGGGDAAARALLGESLALLGRLFCDAGDYESSVSAYEAALGEIRAAKGAASAEAAAATDGAALAHWFAGRVAESRRMYEEALAVKEAVLPPGHPSIAKTCNHLGWIAKDAGEFERAEALLERALAIRRRHFGGEHPEVANSLLYVGALQMRRGLREAARASLERARAVFAGAYGPAHPHVVTCDRNLAVIDAAAPAPAPAPAQAAQAAAEPAAAPAPPDEAEVDMLRGLVRARADALRELPANDLALLRGPGPLRPAAAAARPSPPFPNHVHLPPPAEAGRQGVLGAAALLAGAVPPEAAEEELQAAARAACAQPAFYSDRLPSLDAASIPTAAVQRAEALLADSTPDMLMKAGGARLTGLLEWARALCALHAALARRAPAAAASAASGASGAAETADEGAPAASSSKSTVDGLRREMAAVEAEVSAALAGPLSALQELDEADVAEVKAFARPPPAVERTFAAVLALLGGRGGGWGEVKKATNDPGFIDRLANFDAAGVSAEAVAKAEAALAEVALDAAWEAGPLAGALHEWVAGVCRARRGLARLRELASLVEAAEAEAKREASAPAPAAAAPAGAPPGAAGLEELEAEMKRLQEEVPAALAAPLEAVQQLQRRDVSEVMAYRQPPPVLAKTFAAALTLLDGRGGGWGEIKKATVDPGFIDRLAQFDAAGVSATVIEKAEAALADVPLDAARQTSRLAGVLHEWVASVCRASRGLVRLRELASLLDEAKAQAQAEAEAPAEVPAPAPAPAPAAEAAAGRPAGASASELEAEMGRLQEDIGSALRGPLEALQQLHKADVAEAKAFARPPPAVEKTFAAVLALLGGRGGGWDEAKKATGDPGFIDRLAQFDAAGVSAKAVAKAEAALAEVTLDAARQTSRLAGVLHEWVASVCRASRGLVRLRELAALLDEARAQAQAEAEAQASAQAQAEAPAPSKEGAGAEQEQEEEAGRARGEVEGLRAAREAVAGLQAAELAAAAGAVRAAKSATTPRVPSSQVYAAVAGLLGLPPSELAFQGAVEADPAALLRRLADPGALVPPAGVPVPRGARRAEAALASLADAMPAALRAWAAGFCRAAAPEPAPAPARRPWRGRRAGRGGGASGALAGIAGPSSAASAQLAEKMAAFAAAHRWAHFAALLAIARPSEAGAGPETGDGIAAEAGAGRPRSAGEGGGGDFGLGPGPRRFNAPDRL
eukprot:tig00000402_g177.t1